MITTLIPARLPACIAPLLLAGVMTMLASGCATGTSQFNSALDSHRWADAATAIEADTSLLNNESNLFNAAMLYSFPDRSTYDAMRARTLFERLLKEYPGTPRRQTVIDHLSLLYELQRTSNAATAQQHALEARIDDLASDTLRLHRSLDSIAVRLRAEQDQSALLRKIATRLEADLADRESQLGVLNRELTHLKEIDLQPPLRSRGGDTAITKRPAQPLRPQRQ